MIIAVVCTAGLALAASPANAAGAKTRVARAHALVGTLQKVDGQTLTIQTAKGTETVMLPATAHIMEKGKAIQASQLSQETGARVKVRYADKNGQHEAQYVTVSSQAAKGKKAKA
jgi:hypothetical protein